MDHLWSPWRLEYVTGAKPSGCVFCLRPGVPRSHAGAPAVADAGPPGSAGPAHVGPDAAGAPVRGREAGVSLEAPEPDPLIVYRGRLAYVILNLYPYNNGHLLVVPYRHEPTLAGLTGEEMQDVGLLTQRSEIVLREAYRLDGINVGVNLGRTAGAGIVEHVHVHLVPRWHGDTNFMTVIGHTRVLPEELTSTASRLRPIFERLGRA